jgi:hypothetical protein
MGGSRPGSPVALRAIAASDGRHPRTRATGPQWSRHSAGRPPALNLPGIGGPFSWHLSSRPSSVDAARGPAARRNPSGAAAAPQRPAFARRTLRLGPALFGRHCGRHVVLFFFKCRPHLFL